MSVWEKRKPWNRGTFVATSGRSAPEENSFYNSNGACSEFPVGHSFRAFEKYDFNGAIPPPAEWPPSELEAIMPVSTITAVPAQFEHLETG